jgi:hypothetical protein
LRGMESSQSRGRQYSRIENSFGERRGNPAAPSGCYEAAREIPLLEKQRRSDDTGFGVAPR